ncbi:hypothetical protein COLO4_25413 [Corchorus olitorius]|uniref:Uncharacterized protein n=1 Tax=Corchorus olitorius TaxID=93759 RepID=A0A1R3I333_9ROSI|nr:hypothetical protein COLO4_25413 [Corchorus olitorius]
MLSKEFDCIEAMRRGGSQRQNNGEVRVVPGSSRELVHESKSDDKPRSSDPQCTETTRLHMVPRVEKENDHLVSDKVQVVKGVTRNPIIDGDGRKGDFSLEDDDGFEDGYESCEEVDIDIDIPEEDLKWLDRSVIVMCNESINIHDVAELLKDIDSKVLNQGMLWKEEKTMMKGESLLFKICS